MSDDHLTGKVAGAAFVSGTSVNINGAQYFG